MIQPIKLYNSVYSKQAFKANDVEPVNNTAPVQPQAVVVEAPKEPSRFTKMKVGFLNFFKGVNNVTGTTQGIVNGIVDGAVVTAGVGLVGRSIKNANGQIVGTLKNAGSDLFRAAKEFVSFFPKLLTKPLIEDAKDVVSLVPKFYTTYLKDNKATAAVATIAGLGMFAYRAIGGKIKANVRNAHLDHQLNHGHVK